jgi:aconitate hydratase
MFLGATNAFTGSNGKGTNILTGEKEVSFTKIARDYKSKEQAWLVIGDENYGEGSSREHAAMSPRFLYGKVVLVKSFARIHETNLKKQGVLPLIFKNPADYNKFRQDDLVSLRGLTEIQPDRPLKVVTEHSDGTSEEIEVTHTMSEEQIGWFKAGSALNRISAMIAARK